jgi:hypothetical protein
LILPLLVFAVQNEPLGYHKSKTKWSINACLTANRYHLPMLERRPENMRSRTGKKTAIRLSIFLALGLHAVFLYLPLHLKTQQAETNEVLIEMQLTKRVPVPTAPEPLVQAEEISPPEPDPEPIPEKIAEPIKQVAELPVETQEPEQSLNTTSSTIPYARKNFVEMDATQRQHVANSILSRQFIKEESLTEQLFGKPSVVTTTDHAAEFHQPARASMITMLNQPMPDLPFAYQENLIYFAYDPGVKGDLQRFWDVITPEFGWRTKYGTEVKCIWVLVIAACGWK